MPMNSRSAFCRACDDVFGLKTIVLLHEGARAKPLRVFSETEELQADLCLGDVLQHEFGLSVPTGALVVVLAEGAQPKPAELLAELLWAAVNGSETETPAALHAWLFRSLSPQAGPEIAAQLRSFSGCDLSLSDQAYADYMALCEPGFLLPDPDPSLGEMLSQATSIADWIDRANAQFDQALLVDLPRS